jgi:ribosomal protein S26
MCPGSFLHRSRYVTFVNVNERYPASCALSNRIVRVRMTDDAQENGNKKYFSRTIPLLQEKILFQVVG